jgi:hypothetical protein
MKVGLAPWVTAVVAVLAMVGSLLAAVAAPAGATVPNPLSGAPGVCQPDGTLDTTFTLVDTTDQPLRIDHVAVTGATGQVGSYSTGFIGQTEILVTGTPGNIVGSLTLTVAWEWQNGTTTVLGSSTASVALAGTCAGPPPPNPITGVAECQPDGSYHVVFTLQNTVGQTLTVGSIAGGPGFLWSSASSVPAGGTAQYVFIDIAGSTVGPAELTLTWQWQDTSSTFHNGTSTYTFTLNGSCTPAVAGEYYHPLPPARILDSRAGAGNQGPYSTPWGPGTVRTVPVAGHGGIPADAQAVVLNVTVADTTAPSFLTVWPSGGTQPLASNLNWTAGQVVPNAVTVPLGHDGNLSVANAFGSTDVVIDVAGYYDASPGDGFTSLSPVRILDSRPGAGNQGPFDTPWGPGTTRTVPVAGHGGIPASADAVVLNVTVADTTAPSFLTVWPSGGTQPLASNLNWTAGQVVPNAVTVPLGHDGNLSVANAFGSTDVVIDVAGYYQSGTGYLFHPVTPARILDSRAGAGNQGPYSTPWGPGTARFVTVADQDGVPFAANAVVMNVTVTDTTAPSFLTVWPAELDQPTASNLNWVRGQVVANAMTVPVGSGGAVSMLNAFGNTDVVADVAGWFG